jgi:hypothetical protein
VAVAVRVDEDLEVVVLEDDRVVAGERGPEMGLDQLRPDVEERVVPEHLRARAQRGARPRLAFDVDELGRPGRASPPRIVQRPSTTIGPEARGQT